MYYIAPCITFLANGSHEVLCSSARRDGTGRLRLLLLLQRLLHLLVQPQHEHNVSMACRLSQLCCRPSRPI